MLCLQIAYSTSLATPFVQIFFPIIGLNSRRVWEQLSTTGISKGVLDSPYLLILLIKTRNKEINFGPIRRPHFFA